MLPEPHRTPTCSPALLALRALLTESLAARLAAPEPQPLLAILGSSSVETAHVIWNNSMREELLKVLACWGEPCLCMHEVHVYLHACVHACMRACVHACMRACVHACSMQFVRACGYCLRTVHASMRSGEHTCMRKRQC
jgi:hypothetical protein